MISDNWCKATSIQAGLKSGSTIPAGWLCLFCCVVVVVFFCVFFASEFFIFEVYLTSPIIGCVGSIALKPSIRHFPTDLALDTSCSFLITSRTAIPIAHATGLPPNWNWWNNTHTLTIKPHSNKYRSNFGEAAVAHEKNWKMTKLTKWQN